MKCFGCRGKLEISGLSIGAGSGDVRADTPSLDSGYQRNDGIFPGTRLVMLLSVAQNQNKDRICSASRWKIRPSGGAAGAAFPTYVLPSPA
jgi:hypothetical protein